MLTWYALYSEQIGAESLPLAMESTEHSAAILVAQHPLFTHDGGLSPALHSMGNENIGSLGRWEVSRKHVGLQL